MTDGNLLLIVTTTVLPFFLLLSFAIHKETNEKGIKKRERKIHWSLRGILYHSTTEKFKQEIEKDLNVPKNKISFIHILIPQGVVTVGLFHDANNDTVISRLRADIKIPFGNTTSIAVFIDGPGGKEKSSKQPFSLGDTLWTGISEDGNNWKVIYGPVEVGELLN